jgi:hypothetical protein
LRRACRTEALNAPAAAADTGHLQHRGGARPSTAGRVPGHDMRNEGRGCNSRRLHLLCCNSSNCKDLGLQGTRVSNPPPRESQVANSDRKHLNERLESSFAETALDRATINSRASPSRSRPIFDHGRFLMPTKPTSTQLRPKSSIRAYLAPARSRTAEELPFRVRIGYPARVKCGVPGTRPFSSPIGQASLGATVIACRFPTGRCY